MHLNTMQFHGGPAVYQVLNYSLRAENREDLKPWFLYLKLFLTALYKLPSGSRRLRRGVSSCTTDIQVLKSNAFLGTDGLRTIFSIECINGESIAKDSYFENKEQEIILMPGSYFEVLD